MLSPVSAANGRLLRPDERLLQAELPCLIPEPRTGIVRWDPEHPHTGATLELTNGLKGLQCWQPAYADT